MRLFGRRRQLSSSRRGYGAVWRKIRAVVLLEEPWCPGYPAGYHGDVRVRATCVDHIVAKSKGGSNARGNLRGLCGPCNSRKAVLEEGARPR